MTMRVDATSPRWHNRGTAYAHLEQYHRAIQNLDEAIRLDPQYVDAYYNIGGAYGELSEYKQVIQDYDQANAY